MEKGCISEHIYGGEAVIPINRSSEHAPATTEDFANCVYIYWGTGHNLANWADSRAKVRLGVLLCYLESEGSQKTSVRNIKAQ